VHRIPEGEKFNTLSHLAGFVLAIAGVFLLLIKASAQNDLAKIVSVSIYGLTVISLYLISTLYHGTTGELKNLFRKMDHVGIYLKTVGLYTPFCLLVMRGALGLGVLFAVWFLALIGSVQEILIGHRTRRYSMIIYVLAALVWVPGVPALMAHLPLQGFIWTIGGVGMYGIGFYFYLQDPRIPHAHGIWHMFVLAGTLSLYSCLYFFVI